MENRQIGMSLTKRCLSASAKTHWMCYVLCHHSVGKNKPCNCNMVEKNLLTKKDI